MKNWTVLFIIGTLSIIAGLLALFNPFAASLAVTTFTGWAFIILGVLQIIEAIRAKDLGGKMWTLLLGIVALVLGINILANPMEGLISLTIILGAMFLVSGIFKLIVGFGVHSSVLKWAIVLSGTISCLLGLMVLSNMPGAATIALGVVLAIELISNGISLVSLSMHRKTSIL